MNGFVYSIDRVVRFKDPIGRRRTGRIDRYIHPIESVTDKDYLIYVIVALDNIEGYRYKKYEVQGKDILGYVKKTEEEFMKKEIEENYCGGFAYLPDMVKKSFSQPLFKVGMNKFDYEKIIFNGPATIVIWKDGSKTIAKCADQLYDPEKGVAICFMKRALGETEGKKVLRKASKDYYDEIAREVNRQFDDELKKTTFPLPKGITFRPFNFGISMDNNKIIKVEKEDNNVDQT